MAAQTTTATTADQICKYAYEGTISLLKSKLSENNSFSTRKDTVGVHFISQ